LLFGLVGHLPYLLLLGVMLDKLKVPFSVKQKLLSLCFFLLLIFNRPLCLEHLAFSLNLLNLRFPLEVTSLLLPFEHDHGVINFLLFLSLLLDFPL
jgi:hypothetical protein